MLQSQYLRKNDNFSLSMDVSEACWDSFEDLVEEFTPRLRLELSCGFNSSLLSEVCKDVTSRIQFESLIRPHELKQVRGSFYQSLENSSRCHSCSDILLRIHAIYFGGPNDGNFTDCEGYPFIYAAAFASRFEPTNLGTTKCLFLLYEYKI